MFNPDESAHETHEPIHRYKGRHNAYLHDKASTSQPKPERQNPIACASRDDPAAARASLPFLPTMPINNAASGDASGPPAKSG